MKNDRKTATVNLQVRKSRKNGSKMKKQHSARQRLHLHPLLRSRIVLPSVEHAAQLLGGCFCEYINSII